MEVDTVVPAENINDVHSENGNELSEESSATKECTEENQCFDETNESSKNDEEEDTSVVSAASNNFQDAFNEQNQCSDGSNTKNDNEKDTPAVSDSQGTFKKPVLIIGPRRGQPTKLRTLMPDSAAKVFVDSEPQTNDTQKNELMKQASEKLKLSLKPLKDTKISLGYIEPSWSGTPEANYKMEVLKSGVILETIDLSSKNYHVIGRLPSCDISMAHPTISRFHAIIQYRAVKDEHNEKGMYIYDLGSTHGTFWNGNRIKPKFYVRLHSGHIVKFGCSQRKFILQAPSEDEEPESEYSVTELKEMRRLELEERERQEKQRALEKEEEERLKKEKEESEGIDWGMGEDADEETDLTENPYAQSNNEELFLDDPKKTLRGWFEREGLDMQYQTEDKGIGRFLCWIDLPIDTAAGRTVRAEAYVTGKKKEAVVQCALEACRILDRHGLLRQANHEARKRKARNWEEDDFYDSDEDSFLDRTGTIEKKREQRMRMAGKLETKAETYDSLLEKHSMVTEKIIYIENVLALQKLKREETDNMNEDALDAFMSSLDSSTLDKTETRKMKIDLINLRKEEMQLLKLINIAKPANLPPLKPTSVSIKKSKSDLESLQNVIGHRKKLKSTAEKTETVSKPEESNVEREENENKIDADESKSEDIQEEKSESTKDSTEEKKERIISANNVSEAKEDSSTKNEKDESEEQEKDNARKKKKNAKRNQQKAEKAAKEMKKGYDEDEFREDYSMWMPPENQSGDGKTSLNAKFGY